MYCRSFSSRSQIETSIRVLFTDSCIWITYLKQGYNHQDDCLSFLPSLEVKGELAMPFPYKLTKRIKQDIPSYENKAFTIGKTAWHERVALAVMPGHDMH